MKYFGTDGIRGIIDVSLNSKLIDKISKAIVRYYNIHSLKKKILIGNDSRISSDYIFSQLATTLLKYGIEIHYVGTVSSPALAFLTHEFNYPLSLMISASHNPHEYNGIKFFNSLGEKVFDSFEIEFEKLMDKKSFKVKTDYKKIKNCENLIKYYEKYIKNIKKFNFSIIFDCSNGATSNIVKNIFKKNKIINYNPNGKNINENAGCTHIEVLQKQCIKLNKIGVAFDGDGDRVFIVDEKGNVLNGDKIIYILSKFLTHPTSNIIGTIYSNLGLKKALEKDNKTLIRADVGDKNVYNKMIEYSAELGGEESGHIIAKDFTNTGDGLLIAVLVLNLVERYKQSLSSLLNDYTEYHQTRLNIHLDKPFEINKHLKQEISKLEDNNTRIIVRPSGTEPVLRLFVENENKEKAEKIIKILENLVKNY